LLLVLAMSHTHEAFVDGAGDNSHLKSDLLCSQCSKCDSSKCPPTESYSHMTTHDDSLIAAALQSDYANSKDRCLFGTRY
ncbi:unnamed protein product, partial [Ilex paraguariensis]